MLKRPRPAMKEHQGEAHRPTKRKETSGQRKASDKHGVTATRHNRPAVREWTVSTGSEAHKPLTCEHTVPEVGLEPDFGPC